MASKSLKQGNLAAIYAVLLLDSLAILGIVYPDLLKIDIIATALPRAGAALLGPIIVVFINSLVTSDIKATLVFWRWKDALPGHRAFSYFALRDPRIDIQHLKRILGKFPTVPKEQNAVWYRLLKDVESDESVFQAHRYYLLFRDLSFITLLMVPVVPAILILSSFKTRAALITGAMLLIQWVGATIAARNHGTRLVTNVLAVSASKRI